MQFPRGAQRAALGDLAAEPPGAYDPRPQPSDDLAAEPTGAYDAGAADDDAPCTANPTDPAAPDHLGGSSNPAPPVFARLLDLAQEASRLDLGACTDEQLRHSLDDLRRPLAMLEATRARLLATLEDRTARQVPPGGSVRAAKDEERRRTAERQRISRSRAKREAEAGHAAQQHSATGQAFSQGHIGPEHVRLIAELLNHLPADQRAEVEAQLLVLAREHEPVSFGRRARALLHELAPERTAEAEQRKESRRELRIADTPDGSLALSGLLHGTSAELLRVAIDAFKRFDAPNQPRTVEQRNADALLQLCEVALKAEQAPTQHGARPHVLVIVRAEDLDGGAGPARFGFSGQPVNLAQARRLFSDCVVSRIVFDADGTPIEASANVRTVPAGLHRALVARDGGCTWDGCDAPPAWCDVAHGNVPFRANQPLRIGDAALLCRRHHRRFDHGTYRMVIEGSRVTYLRLDAAGRPIGAPNPGANGPAAGCGTKGSRPPAGSKGSTGPAGASATTTSRWQPPPTESDGSGALGGAAARGPTAGGDDRPIRDPASRRPGDAPPPASPNAPPVPDGRSSSTGGEPDAPAPPRSTGVPATPDPGGQPRLFDTGGG